MATVIKTRTIAAVQENAIQLNTSQFGRLHGLPLGWTKARVGLRLHTTSTGAPLAGLPRLAIGLGSGTTNMIGSATCDNWIGTWTDATWGWSASGYYNITGGGAGILVAKKVGVTLTTGSAITTGQFIGGLAATTGLSRNLIFVDIQRGAPNYTVSMLYRNGSSATDISTMDFKAQMNNTNPINAIANHTFPGTARTIAFDEVAGALDAVQVSWSTSEIAIEICDVAVAVLA